MLAGLTFKIKWNSHLSAKLNYFMIMFEDVPLYIAVAKH